MLSSFIPVLQDKNMTSSRVTDSSDSDITVIIPIDEYEQIYPKELSERMEMPEFDLTEVLEKAPMGKIIISYYESKYCLNDYFRNKLVDIIMTHVFSFHCK